ncbi:MAG: Chaperone protein DnaK [Labilithrix sp.]|nr:Chaperone protein DnaK [Labilithrix sp.]
MTARFVVGIDLGTTHTVVAYAEIDPKKKGAPEPRIFEVAQPITATEQDALPLLPSSLYAPLPGEVSGDPDWVVGELARRRGGEVVGRVVSSAKSWLSHGAVDRLAPILPWGAADEAEGEPARRISPVDASARILAQVRAAWDQDLPDAPLAEQDVVLTLPASFDEVARELTLRAAEQAGLRPFLLEEPSAAFYAAMRGERAIRELAAPSEERTVLVCDVGGGTTDLSLMGIRKASAAPWFTVRRIAVGRHILLGGDNMDLALAHLAEPRLARDGARLEPAEVGQLVQSCREAKERILGDASVTEARVTILGRGSKLVGGARGITLTREEVENVVLAGFFPPVAEHEPPVPRRAAIVSFGLPYEREPAITRHVRQFLVRHASELPRGTPDALLLNGGVFNAPPIARALVAAVSAGGAAPRVLPGTDPDLAVARGAVLFGFARRGVGVRIESGASHGYYVAIAPEQAGGEMRAVCILPRGAREGMRHEAGRSFELVVGRNVRFDLYASDVARDDTGALVTISEDAFERLPPVVAHLPSSGKEQAVPVHLGGELLETGQLELACTEATQPGTAAGRKFRLEFQLREGGARSTSLPPAAPASLRPARMPAADGPARAPSGKLGEADRILERVFGKKNEADAREVKDVVRDLEKTLGDRGGWTMETARALADRLLVNTGARRRTAAHERAYWLLLGYCLRPGFGDPGDPSRIERTWPLFDGRLAFPDEPRGWAQFFIAWRRLSGGLTESMQVTVRDVFDPAFAPPEAKLKKPKRMPDAPDELLSLLSSLERVPAARRAQLGGWVHERTWAGAAAVKLGGIDEARLWSALGRIGARVPVYASVHHVLGPKVVEPWLEHLLNQKWEGIASAPHAAVQLARVTGDRARDVPERLRLELAKRLAQARAKEAWVKAVQELVDVGEEERVAILGEGLPIGLRLVDPAPPLVD